MRRFSNELVVVKGHCYSFLDYPLGWIMSHDGCDCCPTLLSYLPWVIRLIKKIYFYNKNSYTPLKEFSTNLIKLRFFQSIKILCS